MGFTHYWGKSRKGKWIIKCKTASKRLNRSIKAMGKWMREHVHTPEERAELETFVAKGKGAVTKRQHAHILLAAAATGPNGECLDEEIARVLSVSISTIERTRRALCEHGLKVAVHGWPVGTWRVSE